MKSIVVFGMLGALALSGLPACGGSDDGDGGKKDICEDVFGNNRDLTCAEVDDNGNAFELRLFAEGYQCSKDPCATKRDAWFNCTGGGKLTCAQAFSDNCEGEGMSYLLCAHPELIDNRSVCQKAADNNPGLTCGFLTDEGERVDIALFPAGYDCSKDPCATKRDNWINCVGGGKWTCAQAFSDDCEGEGLSYLMCLYP